MGNILRSLKFEGRMLKKGDEYWYRIPVNKRYTYYEGR